MPVMGESSFEAAVQKVMREQQVSRKSAEKIVGSVEQKRARLLKLKLAALKKKRALIANHNHEFIFKGVEIGPYKVASLSQQMGRYAKYWLLNAKQVNGNGWGIAAHTAKENMAKFVGRPLVVTSAKWHGASEYGDKYEHPYLPTNDLNKIFDHQEKFRVGSIVDVQEDRHGDWYATIEMLPKFANFQLPPFCSPAIYQLDAKEDEGAISKWEALHLAALDENPAYGARIALLKGSCVGTANECKVQFKSAKQLNAKGIGGSFFITTNGENIGPFDSHSEYISKQLGKKVNYDDEKLYDKYFNKTNDIRVIDDPEQRFNFMYATPTASQLKFMRNYEKNNPDKLHSYIFNSKPDINFETIRELSSYLTRNKISKLTSLQKNAGTGLPRDFDRDERIEEEFAKLFGGRGENPETEPSPFKLPNYSEEDYEAYVDFVKDSAFRVEDAIDAGLPEKKAFDSAKYTWKEMPEKYKQVLRPYYQKDLSNELSWQKDPSIYTSGKLPMEAQTYIKPGFYKNLKPAFKDIPNFDYMRDKDKLQDTYLSINEELDRVPKTTRAFDDPEKYARLRLAEINRRIKPRIEGSVYDEGYHKRSTQKFITDEDENTGEIGLGFSPAYDEEFASEMGELPPTRVEGSGRPAGAGWASELATELRMKGTGKLTEYPLVKGIKGKANRDPNIAFFTLENAEKYAKVKKAAQKLLVKQSKRKTKRKDIQVDKETDSVFYKGMDVTNRPGDSAKGRMYGPYDDPVSDKTIEVGNKILSRSKKASVNIICPIKKAELKERVAGLRSDTNKAVDKVNVYKKKEKKVKEAIVRSPDKYKVDREFRHTRVDSNGPLINKVPFGPEDRSTTQQGMDRIMRDSSYDVTNKKVYPPKPTQKDRKRIITAKSNPCHPGYTMYGTKDKNGAKVPNCVPTKSAKTKISKVGDMQERLNDMQKYLKHREIEGATEKDYDDEYSAISNYIGLNEKVDPRNYGKTKINPRLKKRLAKIAGLGEENMTYQKSKKVVIRKKKNYPKSRKAQVEFDDPKAESKLTKISDEAWPTEQSTFLSSTGRFIGGGQDHTETIQKIFPKYTYTPEDKMDDGPVTRFSTQYKLPRVQRRMTRAGERISVGIHAPITNAQLKTLQDVEKMGAELGYVVGDIKTGEHGDGFSNMVKALREKKFL